MKERKQANTDKTCFRHRSNVLGYMKLSYIHTEDKVKCVQAYLDIRLSSALLLSAADFYSMDTVLWVIYFFFIFM